MRQVPDVRDPTGSEFHLPTRRGQVLIGELTAPPTCDWEVLPHPTLPAPHHGRAHGHGLVTGPKVCFAERLSRGCPTKRCCPLGRLFRPPIVALSAKRHATPPDAYAVDRQRRARRP